MPRHLGEKTTAENSQPPGELASPARTLVTAVAKAANARKEEIAQEIVTRIISSSDGLADDQKLVQILTEGTEEGVANISHMLNHGTSVEKVNVPPPSVEYVRLTAQRGISLIALERGYRLSQDTILRWFIPQLAKNCNDAAVVAQAALEIMSVVSAHMEKMAQQIADSYGLERERWLLNRRATRLARISDILEGKSVDLNATEKILGYRLRRRHIGMIAWVGKSNDVDDPLVHLENAVGSLATYLGCTVKPLLELRDERTGWIWFPLGSATTVDFKDLTSFVSAWNSPVVLAAGSPLEGVDGFVRTHQQALQAMLVAEASNIPGLRVLPYVDVSAVALMCSDIGASRIWVNEILGPLAANDPTSAQLRETLRVFLVNNSSYSATAALLHMHKNSVMYRIHKAEDRMGRQVRDFRGDLGVALTMCHWLGDTILSRAESQPDPTSDS